MSEEIKNIMNNIENKWKDHYVSDIITNEELKSLHDFVKQVLKVNKTLNEFTTDTENYNKEFEDGKEKMLEIIKMINMKKDKFVVIKDRIINISDIVSIKYIKDGGVLYIRLRNIEIPIRIEKVFNMDYMILLRILEGENKQ